MQQHVSGNRGTAFVVLDPDFTNISTAFNSCHSWRVKHGTPRHVHTQVALGSTITPCTLVLLLRRQPLSLIA
jgi:hypothetical protein